MLLGRREDAPAVGKMHGERGEDVHAACDALAGFAVLHLREQFLHLGLREMAECDWAGIDMVCRPAATACIQTATAALPRRLARMPRDAFWCR